MEYYRTSSHTRFDIKFHFVWTTKYRKQVLVGEVAVRVRALIREICLSRKVQILKGHVAKDHVHLFVSVPPNDSASKLMQYVKGKTSRKMLMEFPHLKRKFWGQHIWARGYFVASSGNVTDEVIQQYIELQEKGKMDDKDFTVES